MKVLVIKTSSLGDIVQTISLVSYLRNLCGATQIDWVSEAASVPLLRAVPGIDKVVSIDTKRWRSALVSRQTYREIEASCRNIQTHRYDVVFDLQGNLKSALVMAVVDAKDKVGFGWETVSERINCLFTTLRYDPPQGRTIREDYLFLVQSYFSVWEEQRSREICLNGSDPAFEEFQSVVRSKQGPRLLISPGSHWNNKRLPVGTLLVLMQKLHADQGGHFFVSWGSLEEEVDAQSIKTTLGSCCTVVPRLSLVGLQQLMRIMDGVITMDSLPLHLCATTGTPTFSLFGPSSRTKYLPIGKGHIGVQGSCPYYITFEKRCPQLRNCSTAACIRRLSAEHLYPELARWWRSVREGLHKETQNRYSAPQGF